jgi:hypothetical protein
LAISYYTGFFKESLDKFFNIFIKLANTGTYNQIKNARELQDRLCIWQWALKAISFLPIHVGMVTRCLELTEAEEKLYEEGKMVTWL